jgi:hypothetical protein
MIYPQYSLICPYHDLIQLTLISCVWMSNFYMFWASEPRLTIEAGSVNQFFSSY